MRFNIISKQNSFVNSFFQKNKNLFLRAKTQVFKLKINEISAKQKRVAQVVKNLSYP